MTDAPQVAPVSFDSVEEAIRAVRDRGMRLSTARRLVLEALFAADGPVSAPQLAQVLQVDATSVYRNLELLERHGLVRHVHLGHGAGLWVLPGRQELEYLYCERCAKVTQVAADDLDSIREQIRQRFGYRVRFTHFALIGLCDQCAGSSASRVSSYRKLTGAVRGR
ncbi:MAG: transcriptional repressor [Solirubrobacterales bacterium]|nr:transcriptional repressor [Solirubrobacterales bacterium]MBV9537116.1 transcriptional repressor [Solirubrobacterales bacterium]